MLEVVAALGAQNSHTPLSTPELAPHDSETQRRCGQANPRSPSYRGVEVYLNLHVGECSAARVPPPTKVQDRVLDLERVSEFIRSDPPPLPIRVLRDGNSEVPVPSHPP